MKKATLALGLLALCGCGSIYNLVTGPQVAGGVRQNDWWFYHGRRPQLAALDLIPSCTADTALLPLTALVELIRWQTGWPPPGVPADDAAPRLR